MTKAERSRALYRKLLDTWARYRAGEVTLYEVGKAEDAYRAAIQS